MFPKVPEAEGTGGKQPITVLFKALAFKFNLKKKNLNVEMQLPLDCSFARTFE